MGGRLKFRGGVSAVVVVLALVLSDTFVNSQYYVNEETNPVYNVNPEIIPGEGIVPQKLAIVEAVPRSPRRMEVESDEDEEDEEDEMEEIVKTPARRRFASRSGTSEDDEDDEDTPAPPSDTRSRLAGRPRPLKLPVGFNDRINKKMKRSKSKKEPLHGDPDPIDEEDEDGRMPEGRLLWPFSIEITKGAKDKGWGGPGGYGSPPDGARFGPPPNAGQYGRIGLHKGRFPPGRDGGYFHASSGWGQQNGWGWDAFIEHEKHRLKYEILKLKAKKKIAVLQNKVELKKLFSMLLQKKIQALEWCYHEWLSHQGGGGWGTGPSWGWGGGYGGGPGAVGVSHPYGWKPGDLTDEEILNSKHYKKYRKKKKKKIKKLKKKLKFKRLVQKILQKHITYLDKIAPY